MSGSAKKQIVIDHGNLTMGTNNTTLKRQKKVKPPVALIRPSTLKQNLLKKIKEHQQRNEETPSMNGGNNTANSGSATLSNQDLSNQFKMSTKYLEQLISKKKDARKHNKKSAKMPQQMQQQMPQQQIPQQMLQQQMPQQMLQQQMPQQQMLQHVSLELPPELQINPIPSIVSAPMQMMSMTPTLMPVHTSQESNEIQLMQPQQLQPPPQPQPQPQQLQPQPQQLQPPPQPQQLQPPPQPQQTQYSNPTPIVLDDVPYGCLRGGNKPTYRTYHRIQNQPKSDPHNTTLKKSLFGNATDAAAPTSDSVDANADPMIQERQRKLREIQSNFQAEKQSQADTQSQTEAPQTDTTKIKNKIKQTITKKYKLGRTAGSNVVGVLIKNSDTRRCIQEEHGALRRESIVEIRKYLHNHGLIKVGSDAPPDVLRNIYESAKMTGDVNNTNKHVMLHNFIKSVDNDTAAT
jgi:hypothetical protein